MNNTELTLHVLEVASGLLDDGIDDVHEEYRRAVIEMTARVLGLSDDELVTISKLIGGRKLP